MPSGTPITSTPAARAEGQLQRGGEKGFQIFRNGATGANGGAQIAVRQRLYIAAKLNIERLIQPQLLADALHDFIAGAVTSRRAGSPRSGVK